jgi:hypothetical protein
VGAGDQVNLALPSLILFSSLCSSLFWSPWLFTYQVHFFCTTKYTSFIAVAITFIVSSLFQLNLRLLVSSLWCDWHTEFSFIYWCIYFTSL